jgi:hypothetical protein
MAVVLAIGATIAVILLVLNLWSSEKKIKHEIQPLFAVGDPQFLRAIGSLLGPAIVSGNRVTILSNRDEDRFRAFPQGFTLEMGEAPRGGRRDLRIPAHHVPL